MLFDDRYEYCLIDEAEFDSMALFAENHCYDKCNRKIIMFYYVDKKICKTVKTLDNYFLTNDLKNEEIITKYYIETFNLNGFELTDRIYVRIYGVGCFFKYLKTEKYLEPKTDENIIKQKFVEYDKKYLQGSDEAFLKGEKQWKK